MLNLISTSYVFKINAFRVQRSQVSNRKREKTQRIEKITGKDDFMRDYTFYKCLHSCVCIFNATPTS